MCKGDHTYAFLRDRPPVSMEIGKQYKIDSIID